jgi:hypothetical protein
MVYPLRKRERDAHRAEQPDPKDMRVSLALDRENQPSQDARERIVRYRAQSALIRAFADSYGEGG